MYNNWYKREAEAWDIISVYYIMFSIFHKSS